MVEASISTDGARALELISINLDTYNREQDGFNRQRMERGLKRQRNLSKRKYK